MIKTSSTKRHDGPLTLFPSCCHWKKSLKKININQKTFSFIFLLDFCSSYCPELFFYKDMLPHKPHLCLSVYHVYLEAVACVNQWPVHSVLDLSPRRQEKQPLSPWKQKTGRKDNSDAESQPCRSKQTSQIYKINPKWRGDSGHCGHFSVKCEK